MVRYHTDRFVNSVNGIVNKVDQAVDVYNIVKKARPFNLKANTAGELLTNFWKVTNKMLKK